MRSHFDCIAMRHAKSIDTSSVIEVFLLSPVIIIFVFIAAFLIAKSRKKEQISKFSKILCALGIITSLMVLALYGNVLIQEHSDRAAWQEECGPAKLEKVEAPNE